MHEPDVKPEDCGYGELDPELADAREERRHAYDEAEHASMHVVDDGDEYGLVAAFAAERAHDSMPLFRPRPALMVRPGAVRFPVENATDINGEFKTSSTCPQLIFRGRGLIVWGATKDTTIHRLIVGREPQFIVGAGGIPGRFFETGLSFADFLTLARSLPEQLRKTDTHERFFKPPALEEIKEWLVWSMLAHPPVLDCQRMVLSTCELGQLITLEYSGPLENAVVWGDYV